MRIYLLTIEGTNSINRFAYADQKQALARLAEWARDWWEEEDIEDEPPENDDEAISAYFEAMQNREWYSIDNLNADTEEPVWQGPDGSVYAMDDWASFSDGIIREFFVAISRDSKTGYVWERDNSCQDGKRQVCDGLAWTGNTLRSSPEGLLDLIRQEYRPAEDDDDTANDDEDDDEDE